MAAVAEHIHKVKGHKLRLQLQLEGIDPKLEGTVQFMVPCVLEIISKDHLKEPPKKMQKKMIQEHSSLRAEADDPEADDQGSVGKATPFLPVEGPPDAEPNATPTMVEDDPIPIRLPWRAPYDLASPSGPSCSRPATI